MTGPAAIAVDGPVASGKTTVGRLLARRLGYRFLDTGIMYRALTWAALQSGIDSQDSDALVRLAQAGILDVTFGADGEARVLVGGSDVAPQLRAHEVDQHVSLVSRVPGVRQMLAAQQHRTARQGSIVMAGRDIGTVVLPHASTKVFLRASPEVRARRRHAELQSSGQDVPFPQVFREIQQRDRLDSERAVAPLKPAPDAHIIDTDDLTVEQVVERILALVKSR